MCFKFPFNLVGKSTMAFLTDQSWHVRKSWYTFGSLEQGVQCCFVMNLTRVYKKCTAVVSFVVQVTAVWLYTTALLQLCQNIILFCAQILFHNLLQLCWRMSFLVPVDICYYDIIQLPLKIKLPVASRFLWTRIALHATQFLLHATVCMRIA